MKIKVLWSFPNGMFKNGICVSQLDYFNRIDKEKYVVEVVTTDDSRMDVVEDYRKCGCIVHVLPNRKKRLLKYLLYFRRLLVKNHYDIVHVHGSSPLMLFELFVSKFSGVKIRIAHSRNTLCNFSFLNVFFRHIFKKTYNVAMACGKEAGEWLFPKQDFIVFHNGKNLDKYKFDVETRRLYRKKLNLGNEVAIGHVGLFNEQKNHSFLIDVFYEIHSINSGTKLFLIGNGSKMDLVKNKVKKLGIDDSVFFLGNLNNVQDYLQAMDIMLFPSLFEGLPNVVIEWQISGLPCILSDKITDECKVTNLVKFLSIDNGVKIWRSLFERTKLFSDDERINSSEKACLDIIKNGFEINSNTKYLEEIYFKLYNKFGGCDD